MTLHLFEKFRDKVQDRIFRFGATVSNVARRTNRTRVICSYLWEESYRLYLYYRYGELFKSRIQGSMMELDLRDRGISADLARDGIREPITTAAYQNEIDRMRRLKNDTVVIIDIGANIGYYALMPPSRIDNCTVLAIEPSPENTHRLQQNIELNDYSESVRVHEAAAGSEAGVASLHHAHYSNFHTMQEQSKREQPERFHETIEVPVKPVSNILDEENIDPSNVDVVRMDVEGYESQIFAGMLSVFESDSDLLLNIEIHPVLMDDEELEVIINQLKRSDASIISASQGDQSIELTSLDEIQTYPWVELVMRL